MTDKKTIKELEKRIDFLEKRQATMIKSLADIVKHLKLIQKNNQTFQGGLDSLRRHHQSVSQLVQKLAKKFEEYDGNDMYFNIKYNDNEKNTD